MQSNLHGSTFGGNLIIKIQGHKIFFREPPFSVRVCRTDSNGYEANQCFIFEERSTDNIEF